jgi:hypothetical protein
MPCRNDSKVVLHSFPPNFEHDTPFLSQALAEHNADRVGDGLSVADYSSLSDAERHDVILRAQRLKSAARYSPIQMEPRAPLAVMKKPPLDDEWEMFSPGAYLLAFAIVGLVSLLWKILG